MLPEMNNGEDKIVTLYSYDKDRAYIEAFPYLWAKGTSLAANSVQAAPPPFNEGFIPVWTGGSWELREDHRGKTMYSTKDKTFSKVDFVGKIKSGYTLIPPTADYQVWNGNAWADGRSPELQYQSYLEELPALTRRQFRMVLVLNGYDLDAVKSKILEIEDTTTRQLTLIEWEDATTFERLNTNLLLMAKMLDLSDEKVNQLWEQGLTL